MLNIAGSARVDDIESPPGWSALHLRSVVLLELSRCRYPDMFSSVWKFLGSSWRFRSSASLHINANMSVTPSSIGQE